MRTWRALIGLVGLSLLLALVASCAQPTTIPRAGATPAQTTPPAKPAPSSAAGSVSFAGKTITIIVPSTPGGSTDIIGRVYGKILPKYLPGKPSMVVRTMTAGGGIVSHGYVYSVAKPDGTTILSGVSKAVLSQLLGAKGVDYDLHKMPVVIAVPGGYTYVIKKGVIDKPEDLPKVRDIKYGSSPSAGAFQFAAVQEMLNIPSAKLILAYEGLADARRAFLAGEVNLVHDTAASYTTNLAPLAAKGELMNLFQGGYLDPKTGNIVKDPGFPPEIPTIGELYQKIHGKAPSGLAWDAYKSLAAATRTYTKTLHLPPGTRDAIVKMYWDAAAKMVQDAEFRAIVDPMVGKDAPWLTGEVSDKGFKQYVRLNPDVLGWLRVLMDRYGVATLE